MYTDIAKDVYEYTKMATKLFVDICILAGYVKLKTATGYCYNMDNTEQYYNMEQCFIEHQYTIL